jgi:hypothetical protein
MSIATLKKKSRALHSTGNNFNTVSVPGVGFTLSGVVRTFGPGHVILQKPYTRTPFKGTEPVGHGGGSRCRVSGWRARATGNHNYPRIISNSGAFYLNENEVRRSTMTTSGMIQKRYVGILHGAYPRTWVQPSIPSSSEYIASLTSQPFLPGCIGTPPNWSGSGFNATGEGSIEKQPSCATNYQGTSSYYAKNLNLYQRDYGTYLQKVRAQCQNPSPSQKPFPYKNYNSTCTTNITTLEEGVELGQVVRA